MHTIDLHGLNREAAQQKIEAALQNAAQHGETVFRIIHGRGKHSGPAGGGFPVLKSWVRHWLATGKCAGLDSYQIYRGEDGSPYTPPNPGETILVLAGAENRSGNYDWEDDAAEREVRDNAKGLRADRLRKLRRKSYR